MMTHEEQGMVEALRRDNRAMEAAMRKLAADLSTSERDRDGLRHEARTWTRRARAYAVEVRRLKLMAGEAVAETEND